MKPYLQDFRDKVIEDAFGIGIVRSAKLHRVSVQSLTTWCHKKNLSFRRKPKHSKACIVCGKIFAYRGRQRVCCSRVCYYQHHHENRLCLICRKPFTVVKSKIRKFCSQSCYALSHRKAIQSPKRRGSNWNTIRRQFRQTRRMCECCGKEIAIDLHHIIPYRYFKQDFVQANNKQNLVALCKECHVMAEKKVRWIFKVLGVFSEKVKAS